MFEVADLLSQWFSYSAAMGFREEPVHLDSGLCQTVLAAQNEYGFILSYRRDV